MSKRKDINRLGSAYLSAKMVSRTVSFVIAVLAAITLCTDSCKNKDDLTPEIMVQFPGDGATFNVPDTVNVGLIVTDETELTNVEVKIIGPNNILASSVASVNPVGSRFEGVLSVELTDKYLPTGDYSVYIRARDGTNESFRFVGVNVNELPKLRRGLVVMLTTGTSTGVFYVDSTGDANVLSNIQQDAGFLCVDDRNDQVVVTGSTTGGILALDLQNGLELWSNTGFHQPPQPTYLDLICDDGDTFISMYDHEIRGLNEVGGLIMNRSTTSTYRPGELFATEDQLLVEQNEVGIARNWMYRYYKDNGVQQDFLEVPINVVAICPFDDESVMIFGNDENNQARVFRYFFMENYTWEPRDLPVGQVTDAVATANGNYAIVHTDGLLHYTYNPNFLNQLPVYGNLGRVRYDVDHGTILVAVGSDIREYNLNGFLVSSSYVPGAIVDFDIHYTK